MTGLVERRASRPPSTPVSARGRPALQWPWLGIDSALANRVRHTVDRQHIRGNPVVHAVSFRVSDHIVERHHHDVPQTLVDLRLFPEVALAILHPLEIRSSHAPGI